MSVELISQLVLFCVSLFALVKASDWFVSAAENIGLALGVSPFIIGVTIVAFGTSLPELASSIAAVLAGSSEIVVGNVVGSNITNILLVLGFTVVIGKEIKLDFNVMDVDMPLLIASAFLLWFVLSDLHVSLIEAIIFLGALVVFLLNSVLKKNPDKKEDREKVLPKDVLMLIGGGVFVYLGATFTIAAIEKISVLLEFPPEIIAVTGVALGTSLPEVVVSITAARKGSAAIAVGNVLGSNIFNTYAVMAIPALIGPLEIPADMLTFHIPFMIAMTFLFALVCLSGKITRWEGTMLVLLYVYFIYESIRSGL
jgi:cation:H+ antiporter